MNPLVSIIIPVYNRANLLAETLESVLAQSYPHWECILVDDGSTDDSPAVAQSYHQKDLRFKVFQRPESRTKGANACRNFGFEVCAGTLINWFDSDDLMHEDFCREKVSCLIQHPEINAVLSKRAAFAVSPQQIIWREHRTFLTPDILEDFLSLKVAWYTEDGMWRRSFLEGKLLFDEHLLAGQDRDFHARMLLYDPKLYVVDQHLSYNRRHEATITAAVDNRKDSRLKISHLESVDRLVNLIFKAGRMTPGIRKSLFASMIKYLPYAYRDSKNFSTLLRVLKRLSFASPAIYKGWAKFWTAWFSFRIFGKGAKFLK